MRFTTVEMGSVCELVSSQTEERKQDDLVKREKWGEEVHRTHFDFGTSWHLTRLRTFRLKLFTFLSISAFRVPSRFA